METKITTLVYSILALTIMVMLIFTTVIPTVENAQESEYTTANNSSSRYIAVLDEGAILAVDGDGIPTINGEKISEFVDVPASGAFQVWVLSNNFLLRTQSVDGTWENYWFLYYESSGSGTRTTINGSMTFECSNGVAKVMSGGEATIELTYTYLLVPSTTGNYVEYSRDVAGVFVDSGKTIYIGTASASTTWTTAYGTIDNITVVKNFNSGTATTATITVDYTETAHDASNELSSISATGATLGLTTSVFVPLEYTVISDNGNSVVVLLGIIPLILIIVCVLFAVRMMGSRN